MLLALRVSLHVPLNTALTLDSEGRLGRLGFFSLLFSPGCFYFLSSVGNSTLPMKFRLLGFRGGGDWNISQRRNHNHKRNQRRRHPPSLFSNSRTITAAIGTVGSLSLQTQGMVGTFLMDLTINWVGWAASYALKTEMFYDIVGTVTTLATVLGSLTHGGSGRSGSSAAVAGYGPRQIAATAMVGIWAIRLGSFLFYRAVKNGGDSRFHGVLDKPGTLFFFWTMQAIWCWVICLPVTVLNGSSSSDQHNAIGWTDIVGPALWSFGMVIECIADFQKWIFKSNARNKGKFIHTGLYKLSRYPQYFGEMSLWWGVYTFCAGQFKGWEYAAVASPLFTMLILTKLSGIPIQERQARERWSNDEDYQEYRRNTRLLVPFPKFQRKLK